MNHLKNATYYLNSIRNLLFSLTNIFKELHGLQQVGELSVGGGCEGVVVEDLAGHGHGLDVGAAVGDRGVAEDEGAGARDLLVEGRQHQGRGGAGGGGAAGAGLENKGIV